MSDIFVPGVNGGISVIPFASKGRPGDEPPRVVP